MRCIAKSVIAAVCCAVALGACNDAGPKDDPGSSSTDAGGDHGSDADSDTDADFEEILDMVVGEEDPDGPAIDLRAVCDEAEELGPYEQAMVDASNDFGFETMRRVVEHSDGGNAYIAPLSLHTVLSMTFNGARTSTADEMRGVLRYGGLSLDEIDTGYEGLLGVLADRDPAVTLALADSVWIRDSFFVLPEFIEVVESVYDAEVSQIDFDAEDAADTINAWVFDNTGGLIPDIVDSPISPLTVMFLIDATYLRAPWSYRFEPEDTTLETFHSSTAGDVEVETMHLVGCVFCYQDELLRSVQLPYGGGLFAMTVLQPREDATVDDVIEALGPELWQDIDYSSFIGEAHVGLPRFELSFDAVSDGPTSEPTLNDPLAEMGMPGAFGSAADFTGITGPPPLVHIEKVKHKTFVRVDEEGTESAAASMVEFEAIDGDVDPPEFEFEIDRPFLIAISDRCSGAVLFLGKIVEPPPIEE